MQRAPHILTFRVRANRIGRFGDEVDRPGELWENCNRGLFIDRYSANFVIYGENFALHVFPLSSCSMIAQAGGGASCVYNAGQERSRGDATCLFSKQRTLHWLERKLRKWVLSDFCWQVIPSWLSVWGVPVLSLRGGSKFESKKKQTPLEEWDRGGLQCWRNDFLVVGKFGSGLREVIEIYWLIGTTWQIQEIYERRSVMEVKNFTRLEENNISIWNCQQIGKLKDGSQFIAQVFKS